MLDTMQIPWELFPAESGAIAGALDRAIAHMDETGRPYALLMQKGSVAEFALAPGSALRGTRDSGPARAAQAVVQPHRPAPAARPSRQEALRQVVAQTSDADTVLLASTGFCGRELYAIEDRANQLYMVGLHGMRRAPGAGGWRWPGRICASLPWTGTARH